MKPSTLVPIKTDAFIPESSPWGRLEFQWKSAQVGCARGATDASGAGPEPDRRSEAQQRRHCLPGRGRSWLHESRSALVLPFDSCFQRLICKLLKTSASQMRALFPCCAMFFVFIVEISN